jgi:predicted  nucleic acid-binding Zn-ribbon protein
MGSFSEDFYVRLRVDQSALRTDFRSANQSIENSFNSTIGGMTKLNTAVATTSAHITSQKTALKANADGWQTMTGQIGNAIVKMALWGVAGTALYGSLRAIQDWIGAGKQWIDILEDTEAIMGGTIEQQIKFAFMSKVVGVEMNTMMKAIATLRQQMSTKTGRKLISQILGIGEENLQKEFGDVYLLMGKLADASKQAGDSGRYLKQLFGMKGYEVGKFIQTSAAEMNELSKVLDETMKILGIDVTAEGIENLKLLDNQIQANREAIKLLSLGIQKNLQPALLEVYKILFQITKMFLKWGEWGSSGGLAGKILGMFKPKPKTGGGTTSGMMEERTWDYTQPTPDPTGGGGTREHGYVTNIKEILPYMERLNNYLSKSSMLMSKNGLEFNGSSQQIRIYKEEIAKLTPEFEILNKKYGEDLNNKKNIRDAITTEVTWLNTHAKAAESEYKTHEKILKALKEKATAMEDNAKATKEASDALDKYNDTTRKFDDTQMKQTMELMAGKGDMGSIAALWSTMTEDVGTQQALKTFQSAYGAYGGGTKGLGAGLGALGGRAIGAATGIPGGEQVGQVIGSFVGSLVTGQDDIYAYNKAIEAITLRTEDWDVAMQMHSQSMDELNEQINKAKKNYDEAAKSFEENKEPYRSTIYGRELDQAKLSAKQAAEADMRKWGDELKILQSSYAATQEDLKIVEHNARMKGDKEAELYKLEEYKKIYNTYRDSLDRETRWMLEENIWRIEQNININADVKDVRDIEELSRQIVERVVLYGNSRFTTLPFGRF